MKSHLQCDFIRDTLALSYIIPSKEFEEVPYIFILKWHSSQLLFNELST